MEKGNRGNRLAVGVQGRGEILVYDSSARVVMILRPPGCGIPTDRDQFLHHAATTNTGSSGGAAQESAEVTASHLPDTLPGFDRIIYDSAGRLWVEEYLPEYLAREPNWWIFDSTGQLLAQAKLPDDLVPHQIEADAVIGVTRDEADVQFVERRRIGRDSPAQ